QGYPCAIYRPGRAPWSEFPPLSEVPHLEQWLTSLPKPVGVLAWESRYGHLLTEACSRAKIRVPKDVGVIVTLNDDVLCEIATPPLSSVDSDPIRVGYEAAALLARLIEGSASPTLKIRIPPAGVTIRSSTRPVAIEDPVLADAVKFIQRHAHRSIS